MEYSSMDLEKEILPNQQVYVLQIWTLPQIPVGVMLLNYFSAVMSHLRVFILQVSQKH